MYIWANGAYCFIVIWIDYTLSNWQSGHIMEFCIFPCEEMEPNLQYFTNVMRLSPTAFLLVQKAHAFPSEGCLELRAADKNKQSLDYKD